MNIVLLGAPGAGKGTRAKLLQRELQVPHISTGDMLRAAIAQGDPLALAVKDQMDAGILVPDTIMTQLVISRLKQVDCRRGFILDGFPRNLPQARLLESGGIKIEYVLYLDVPLAALTARQNGRRFLMQRADDNPAVVATRMQVYANETGPLIPHYKQQAAQNRLQFITVESVESRQDVEQILKLIKPESKQYALKPRL